MMKREDYILLVEDDSDSREALSMILEIEGRRIVCASNGKEAIEQLKSDPHACLILLDLMMPVMDGWEFRRLQKLDPKLAGIPTIVVSAIGDPQKRPNGDVAAFLPKPIDAEKLLIAVDQYC